MLFSPPLLRIPVLFCEEEEEEEEEKNQLTLNLFMDFCDQCEVHSEGLAGTRLIPVNVVEGELPLMLFSLPLGSKSMWVLSRPGRHAGGTSSSLFFTHAAPGQRRGRWGLTERQLGSILPTDKPTLPGANCGSNQGLKYCLLIG